MRLGEWIQWRLSEMGKPVFWLDTIPLHERKAASRAASGRTSGASSAEPSAHYPVKCPGNSRVFFGPRPGNGRIVSELRLANVRHDVRSRIQSMTSPRL
jgi:hypothetical protein